MTAVCPPKAIHCYTKNEYTREQGVDPPGGGENLVVASTGNTAEL